ncbi:NifU family protein [Actinomadura parmotrematis]|uniref:NifU family protein n=1 Tax=Actinomadura parmotrematis TaxID=2864039 RepID=A0ABS7FZJ2_9ACTN|nr:NifU family protein [Actinomadura parmotrematis]MBW8485863.1 NifU family protein [Actinomadura parmotrematis]
MGDPDGPDVPAVVGALNTVLRGHGGGVRLVRDGAVPAVRYTGMCAGCPGRPACHEGLVAPALLALPGVRGVEAPGTRLDGTARDLLQQFTRAEGGSA